MNLWRTMHDDVAAFGSLSPTDKMAQLERMANYPDPEIRSRSLILARRNRFSADTLCEKLSRDPVDGVRYLAMEHAYFWGGTTLAPRVKEMLIHDPEEAVRSFAAYAVRSICSKTDIPYLQSLIDVVKGFDHEDVPVRSTLIESINVLLEGDGMESPANSGNACTINSRRSLQANSNRERSPPSE